MDPALFSLNWFLCLFVEYLPVNTYLHIWDAFLFEGSKVDTERYFYQKHIEVSNPKKWVGLVNYLSMNLLISTPCEWPNELRNYFRKSLTIESESLNRNTLNI